MDGSEDSDISRTGGSEVVSSGRIDFELEDRMFVPPLKFMKVGSHQGTQLLQAIV